MSPPVSEGEELDIRIEALGGKGDGIAKVKGFVLFVPNVKEGETCKVRVTRVLKSVGFAEKIGEATSEPERPRERREAQPEPEPEPIADSEDFGEENSDSSSEDSGSEDELREEPKEESSEDESDDWG